MRMQRLEVEYLRNWVSSGPWKLMGDSYSCSFVVSDSHKLSWLAGYCPAESAATMIVAGCCISNGCCSTNASKCS